jgi:hypothetical protein
MREKAGTNYIENNHKDPQPIQLLKFVLLNSKYRTV